MIFLLFFSVVCCVANTNATEQENQKQDGIALSEAIKCGDTTTAMKLLEKCGDNYYTYFSSTNPLGIAILIHTDMAYLLLKLGVDPNSKDMDFLRIASHYIGNKPSAYLMLLCAGASCDYKWTKSPKNRQEELCKMVSDHLEWSLPLHFWAYVKSFGKNVEEYSENYAYLIAYQWSHQGDKAFAVLRTIREFAAECKLDNHETYIKIITKALCLMPRPSQQNITYGLSQVRSLKDHFTLSLALKGFPIMIAPKFQEVVFGKHHWQRCMQQKLYCDAKKLADCVILTE